MERGIPRIKESGIVFLGTPIGSHEFSHDWIKSKILSVNDVTNHLPLLKDAHVEFVLLKSCLALPKIMFILCTTDPTNNRGLWDTFDDITREALIRIIVSPMTDIQWSQVNLPVSMGGLGLKAAVDHAHAAYASSLLSSEQIRQALLDLPGEDSLISIPQPVLEVLSNMQDEEATTDSLRGVPQKATSYKIDKSNSNLLMNNLTREGGVRDVARLPGCQAALSGPATCWRLALHQPWASTSAQWSSLCLSRTGWASSCQGMPCLMLSTTK